MKVRVLILAVGIAVAAVGLFSQTTQTTQSGQTGAVTTWRFVTGSQEAGTLGQIVQDQITSLPMVYSLSGMATIAGRPFSATEESKTVQTLGDGTQIVNSQNRQLYRDVNGRTRTEQTVGNRKSIQIGDPVNGFTARLDPDAKTATRSQLAVAGGRGGGDAVLTMVPRESAGVAIAGTPAKKEQKNNASDDDLGIQNINGVPALGTRHTQIIPAGQIGNNRDIKIVNERWYSEELQMVVKTVNSDPRFGETTYELTNIVRGDPSPSLFVIPADYSVSEGGRGGARKKADVTVDKK